MSRSPSILLVALLFAAGFGADIASAECIVVLGTCSEFTQAAAVIDATVETDEAVDTLVVGGMPAHRARLRVQRSWKGIGSALSVDIFTLRGGMDSTVVLSPGRRYLFFARRDSHGRLWAQSCERTVPIEEAGDHIAFLVENGRPGAKGSVYGHASRSTQGEADRWSENNRSVELVGVEVVLKRANGPPRSVRTDDFGNFSFDNVEPGVSYEVTIVPPAGLRRPSWDSKPIMFTLADGRECADGGFHLVPASTEPVPVPPGRLAGRVTDWAGAVLPGVTVAASGVGPSRHSAVSDANGWFRIPDLAAGTYSVEAKLTGFQTVTRSGVEVRDGRSEPFFVSLCVGGGAMAEILWVLPGSYDEMVRTAGAIVHARITATRTDPDCHDVWIHTAEVVSVIKGPDEDGIRWIEVFQQRSTTEQTPYSVGTELIVPLASIRGRSGRPAERVGGPFGVYFVMGGTVLRARDWGTSRYDNMKLADFLDVLRGLVR